MSVVVVSKCEDQIDIASDSQVSFGSNFIRDQPDSKLFQREGFVVGAVGDAAPVGLMKIYMLTHRPEAATEDAITNFMREFRVWLALHNGTSDEENEYIFILDDRVFWEANFYVREILDYFAIGSGTDFCLAAIDLGHDVVEAVEVACAHSIHCCEPVNLITVKTKTWRDALTN